MSPKVLCYLFANNYSKDINGLLQLANDVIGNVPTFANVSKGTPFSYSELVQTLDAINRGFTRATGAIFSWLSADDLYEPGAVTAAVDYLLRNPEADVVYGEAVWIDAHGNVLGRYPTEPFRADRLRRECFICQPAAFMRADTFRRAGMLDANDQLAFDYDLWIRLARFARFHWLDRPLARSRMHAGNKTLGQRRQILEAGMDVLRRNYGYVPPSWVYAWVSHNLDERDQFFTPMKHSAGAYLLALPAGCWMNWRQPLRYLWEWFLVALHGLRKHAKT